MVNASRLFRRLVALALSLFCITAAQAGPYSALYAFGDSLSDVGNDLHIYGNAVPRSTIYTDGTNTGRFTNGLNYLDGLSSLLGLGPLAPSELGGTNYAYGGARTTYADAPILSFNDQIAAFDSTHPPGTADSNALYVLWIGANDMSDAIRNAAVAIFLGDDPSLVIGAAIGNAMSSIAGAIGNLVGLGATHFLVPNIPDLSLTPRIRDLNDPLGASVLAHQVSLAFNDALAATLNGAFSALDIRDLDVFGLLNDIVSDPAGNGFANVTDSCYKGDVDGSDIGAGTGVCGTPGKYVFWDYQHPTAATHALLAERAFAAVVPEPPAIWMLVFVMAGVATFARRRQSRVPALLPN